MKEYIVYFREPVAVTSQTQRFNKELCTWEDVEITEMVTTVTFYTLSAAKRFIKLHLDKYAGSEIIKVWSNGDFECLGEISLKGSNKTFVANTRQKVAGY